jgi:phosphatidate phosphatase LPIN
MFSGAMDVLVIQSPSGEFHSSSFHVRFGSLKVIRAENKVVDIYINGEKKDVKMYLSPGGDAFFAYDELDRYMIKQSELIAENDIKTNLITLNEVITEGKRITEDDKLFKQKYKSFFPSSNQIKKLELKEGPNEILYVVESTTGGIQTLKSRIYLWKSTEKLIISDIDGTITKSDVLGYIFPVFGKDWSHEGVTDLFTNLYKNGYKIIYLTARAIGQSTMTKNYLNNLIQEKQKLPPGPMLMSPDGLFSALKREIIQRKPHLLKIPLLTEIKNLFPENTKPFFAGFGNRDTDAIAYRYLDIPLNNIFIVDPKSEVIQLGIEGTTTYQNINNELEKYFPKDN